MQRFIVQRVLQSLLALLFLSVVVFFMTWATGDPVRYIKPPEEITEEEIEALRKAGPFQSHERSVTTVDG